MIRSGVDFKPSVSLHVHKIKANHEKLHDEHSQRRFCICMVNSGRLYDSITWLFAYCKGGASCMRN